MNHDTQHGAALSVALIGLAALAGGLLLAQFVARPVERTVSVAPPLLTHEEVQEIAQGDEAFEGEDGPNEYDSTPDEVSPDVDVAADSESLTTDESAAPARPDSGQREVITLAGGCFWCTESYMQETPGVIAAISGYAGGSKDEATYKQVSSGTTGHYEAVRVTYDPSRISTEELLDVFWAHIDPTDAGGQFADRGSQYHTAIYYHSPEQKRIAEDSKDRLAQSELFDEPIATDILPYTTFFPAEEYHQDYYKKAADHYERYKKASGRAGFVEETWAKDAALLFLAEEETMHNDTNPTYKSGYDYSEKEIAALRANLDPDVYRIVAENGTEPAFNNEYWDNHDEGIYVDVVTGEPLFSSTNKYDSGTGWPSFYRPISEEAVEEVADTSHGMIRTEVRSDGGHLGHVFNDGPKEHGGERYCINSASLLFVPRSEMEERGYGEYLHLFDQV